MKRLLTITIAVVVTMSTSLTAFAAAGWQKNDVGWWYVTNDLGTVWYANTWQWIDGNGDGVAECYYFDADGYMLANTTTPDGYTVNADGAWTENGVVQVKSVPLPTPNQNGTGSGAVPTENSANEIANAVARAKSAGAGANQSKYDATGYRIETTQQYMHSSGKVETCTWKYVSFTMDANGMLISPTSGIGVVYDGPGVAGGWEHSEDVVGGSDRSIRLANDPANGNLQPNWLYNPMGKVSTPPSLISMYKTTYDHSLSINLGGTANDAFVIRGMDTSGSWVYDGNPSGSNMVNQNPGTVTGWRYRFADGTYAANGLVPIYESTNSSGDLIGTWFVFNEDGFLIKDSKVVNSYGQIYNPTSKATYYMWWYWNQ